MTIGILTASYITSSVLFILALGGLSNQEKAKRAVWYGIFGMAIAVAATIFGNQVFLTEWLGYSCKKSSNDRHATACCSTSLICWISGCVYWN
jgi:hypothetical protein